MTTEAKKKRGSKPHVAEYQMATVYLAKPQVALLDALAANAGRSRSDLIREAINRTYMPR